jgi:hypothetical protein
MVESAAFDFPVNRADNLNMSLFNIAIKPPVPKSWGSLVPIAVHRIIADPSLILAANALSPHESRFSPFASEAERIEMLKKPLAPINVDHLFGKHKINADTLTRESTRTTAIFPMISMINHSCIPNAAEDILRNVRFDFALMYVHALMADQIRLGAGRYTVRYGDHPQLHQLLRWVGETN